MMYAHPFPMPFLAPPPFPFAHCGFSSVVPSQLHQNRVICFVTTFICGCAFPMYNIGDSFSSARNSFELYFFLFLLPKYLFCCGKYLFLCPLN
jgi:hypothetical protein